MFNRIHGNTKRAPHNRFSTEDINRVVDFIDSYAQMHAMLLPGRIPGYKSSTLQLLPSSSTKTSIWSSYVQLVQGMRARAASRTYFGELWKNLRPEVVICKPMSDLCWICHQNSTAIICSANRPENEKSQVKHKIIKSKITYYHFRY